jgi:hypothetical protein
MIRIADCAGQFAVALLVGIAKALAKALRADRRHGFMARFHQ